MSKIIIVTKDFSGTGFAILAQKQGDDVIIAHKMDPDEKNIESYKLVGNGIVNKKNLDQAMKTEVGKGNYWIFDMNYWPEYADKLRAIGEKVLGSGLFNSKMEHDRNFGMSVAKEAGLDIGEVHEFNDLQSGLDFIDSRPDEAWVFKPDGSDLSYLTFVPSNYDDKQANRELYSYLKYLKEGTDSYILQKRIKGIEINVEAWFYKGTPFFAFCDLENKRKLNRDCGCNVGCAQDVVFPIALESKLVKDTIGKLFQFYKKQEYTGFGDVNVIISDKKYIFLEFCNRFGYNAHPNLFMTVAKDSFGNIVRAILDGNIYNFYEHFRYGFGASITIYNDHPRIGLPLMLTEDGEKKFYPFEVYTEGEDLLIPGYSNEVGIVCCHGYEIEDAAKEAVDIVDAYEDINFPDISYRSDLYKSEQINSPIKRYAAIKSMGLI